MKRKEILKHNEEQFLIDLKEVYEFSVYCSKSNWFFKIRKSEVLKKAASGEIRYYITDKIFVVKRNVMVII